MIYQAHQSLVTSPCEYKILELDDKLQGNKINSLVKTIISENC